MTSAWSRWPTAHLQGPRHWLRRSARRTRGRPAVYADYRELLAKEKLDAVSLALPTVLNPEVTEAAMAAGCHVIAEKPIAASLADGERMAACARREGRMLMTAENYRYMASYTLNG